ncbi:hypothetical protein [Streptomyces sp. SM12]|uniref:hypothetical protein n=1 Tax=Streptomyces sp. SM12 TaxID=1071602 RepID=UPI0011B00ED0|nr:hypothetical protein [Streptomyces sp. SM12]
MDFSQCTEIFEAMPGRSLGPSDLADAIEEATGMSHREAQEAIWATFVDMDGEEISRADAGHTSESGDTHYGHHVTISGETAEHIFNAVVQQHELTN